MRVAQNDQDARAGLRGYVQLNKYTRTHTHISSMERRISQCKATPTPGTWWKVHRKDRSHTSQVTYLWNVWASCRPVGRRPSVPGQSVQVLNGNRHKSNYLARNHPRNESQPHSPSQNQTQFTCPLCPREKIYQGTAASVAGTNTRFTPGRGTAFLKNAGDRYK